jgi:hypothetical protein
MVLHNLPADIEKPSVLYPGRTGCLTGATRQAAMQMNNTVIRDGVVFQQIFDEVDAPTRSVEFIAEQLIRWTSGCTKPAVHTFSQYGIGLLHFGQRDQVWMDIGLH